MHTSSRGYGKKVCLKLRVRRWTKVALVALLVMKDADEHVFPSVLQWWGCFRSASDTAAAVFSARTSCALILPLSAATLAELRMVNQQFTTPRAQSAGHIYSRRAQGVETWRRYPAPSFNLPSLKTYINWNYPPPPRNSGSKKFLWIRY